MAADSVSKATTAIQKGRYWILTNSSADFAFFAELCIIPWEISGKANTACTDGVRLYFNPDYVNKLSHDEVVDLILEETLHVALLHCHRFSDRDHSLWNQACDLAIFELLQSVGRKIPEGCCVVGRGPYKDFPKHETADHYYALLLKESEKSPDKKPGSGSGSGKAEVFKFGSISGESGKSGEEPGEGSEGKASGNSLLSAATAEESEEIIKALVKKASAVAKARGSGSFAIASAIDKSTARTLDYRVELRRYRDIVVKGGTDWGRKNRRAHSSGYYIPQSRHRAVGDVAIAIDCSGSVSQEEVARFVAECEAVFKEAGNKVVLLWHDTSVLMVQEWKSGGPRPKFQRPGFGGTCHRDVFEQIAKLPKRPAVIICLTDLETRFPSAPAVPVLWVAPHKTSIVPPFGRVCTMPV